MKVYNYINFGLGKVLSHTAGTAALVSAMTGAVSPLALKIYDDAQEKKARKKASTGIKNKILNTIDKKRLDKIGKKARVGQINSGGYKNVAIEGLKFGAKTGALVGLGKSLGEEIIDAADRRKKRGT